MALARDILALWLGQREKAMLHQQIAAYAAACAGTEHDLDEALEAETIAHLYSEDEKE